MNDFLTNPWTIGIGGSIISSIIVYFFTNRIISKRENKEYKQKIHSANNELLYAIRPLIVEQKLPSFEIFNSIITATAKKYAVKSEDLYNQSDIADDLTKEIMDNSFLTSDNKLIYCELAEKMKELGKTQDETSGNKTEVVFVEKERTTSREYISMLLALMSAMMSVMLTFISFKDGRLFSWSDRLSSNDMDWIYILMISTTIPVLAMTITRMLAHIRKTRYDTKKDTQINEDGKGIDEKL